MKTHWPSIVAPVVALLSVPAFSQIDLIAAATPIGMRIVASVALIAVLFAAISAAVHHAEEIAHRVGEPYGTLILTIAVTVIEVALIATSMVGDHPKPALARDTVFAVIMIVCNGLVGLCIVLGGLRYREQGFRAKGVAAYLIVLMPLSVLTLILPNFTTPVGPIYSVAQLTFVGIAVLALYFVFLFIQTIQHRDYFADLSDQDSPIGSAAFDRRMMTNLGMLLVALIAVILLSKQFALLAEAVTAAADAPEGMVGIAVALLILMPEGVAAVRAARSNRLQQSLNLALGSSLATIGLTIPVIAAVSIFTKQNLLLGLEGKDMVLLVLTLIVAALTFGTGRTNILSGFVHLVLFATYVFLTLLP
ncbi:calcium:proton antiporter [Roseiterribacter gracilis]|uniref:Ionic transporter y4hA n=1 Tax=Roseiterribacter gracilis TaxID=2812848 RepID=A0A8S8XB19_9PROT|nr:ionic transporter y4hA [Rhodospirillales bacterium TMPK1]